MEHYSVLKRKKLMLHTKIWANLKIIMLCEKVKPKNSTCSIISFIEESRKYKTLIMTDTIIGAVWGEGLRWARNSNYKGA